MPSHTKAEQQKNARHKVKNLLSGIKAPIPGSSNRLLQRTINPLEAVLKTLKLKKKKK